MFNPNQMIVHVPLVNYSGVSRRLIGLNLTHINNPPSLLINGRENLWLLFVLAH